MVDRDILKMLFEEHHRQYQARWQGIHLAARGTVASLALISGWILLARQPPAPEIRPLLMGFVLVLTFLSGATIVSSIRNIRKIAEVIERVNIALGLYQVGRYLEGESLYPPEWRGFGTRHKWAVIANLVLLCVAAAMAIGTILLRH